MNKLSKKAIILTFTIIVSVNFFYAITYRIKPVVDAEAYNEIATNIIERGEYRSNNTTPLFLDGSITRIGPGYELFLAINYLFWGKYFWIIWLMQSILFAITILILGTLSINIFPQLQNNLKYVYTSMFFLGLLIDMVQLNGMLMTESLFIFILSLCFYIFYRIFYHDEIKHWYLWTLLGLMLGLLTLIRPTGLLIFLLFTSISIYKHRMKSIVLLISLMLAFICIQLPWFIRNYKIYNQFIFHSTADGMNLFSGNYPGNHGEFNSDFPLFKEYKQKYPAPTEFNKVAKKWYVNFVLDTPITAITILLEKTLMMFSLAKTSGFWFHYLGRPDQIITIIVSIFQNFILFFLIILYYLIVIKKFIKDKIVNMDIVVFATSLILMLTPILTVISNRHRLPLVIMSLPILGYMFFYLHNNFKHIYREIAITILIISISTFFDIYMQFDKFKLRMGSISIENFENLTNDNV